MNWISVKKEMPYEGEKVLVYTSRDKAHGGVITSAMCVNREKQIWIDSSLFLNVKYWMPLPPQPDNES